MDIQRVRTLTTGKMHTDIADVYEDIYRLVGEAGIVTHMIPNAIRALRPFLLRRLPDPRFWNGEYDPTHVGDVPVAPLNADELTQFFLTFARGR